MNKSSSDNQNLQTPLADTFKQTNEYLKNTYTSVEYEGVKVTLTAEPKIIEININSNVKISELPEKLKKCLNEAFQKSIQKVFEKAVNELSKKDNYFEKK